MVALWDRESPAQANGERRLPPVEQGYLAQPEMRSLIQVALDFRRTLLSYGVDMSKRRRRI
jgi:hypothetical protein